MYAIARGRSQRFFGWPLPALHYSLAVASNGEFAGGGIAVDDGAGSDGRVLANGYRRDEGAIGADEDAVFDARHVLVHAVVVAGDGAGTDVHVGTDVGVADVGKVVRL